MTLSTYIPPLAVSRIIGTYHFEDGGYVAIVGDGKCSTAAMLDMAQEFITLKRAELAASGIEAATADETRSTEPSS